MCVCGWGLEQLVIIRMAVLGWRRRGVGVLIVVGENRWWWWLLSGWLVAGGLVKLQARDGLHQLGLHSGVGVLRCLRG